MKSERIYIGGLDPNKGLNVELVASRLCSVQNVEILSINDTPIKNNTLERRSDNQTIYHTARSSVVDEDGDVVDTRNFFFLEARYTGGRNNDDCYDRVVAPSALELLAKQYHNTKWKGCQLRVESAKPHFLKRLEEERAERKAREERQRLNNASKEISGESKDDEGTENGRESEDKDIETIKQRRRLRIRKRYGEEAFHVDTFPHLLELTSSTDQPTDEKINREGWKAFAMLHKRMHNKLVSQRNKLVQKRKEERRMWASGSGKVKRDDKPRAQESSMDLNSLVFLNRGIHIRFCDDVKVPKLDDVREKDHVSIEHTMLLDTSSSSYVSSSEEDVNDKAVDDSSTSTDEDRNAADNNTSYVWSDEESEDDGAIKSGPVNLDSDVSSEASDDDESKIQNKGQSENEKDQYEWSGDEDDIADNERKTNVTAVQKQQKIMRSIEYTESIVMDEFSGGFEFDDTNDICYDGVHDAGDPENMEESKIDLDGDIVFNLSVLSKIFPGENIENQQLKARPKAGDDSGFSQDASSTNATAVFGAGLIMQRYDPTIESAKKFEITKIQADIGNVAEMKPENAAETKGDEVDAAGESSKKNEFGKNEDDGSFEPESADNAGSDNTVANTTVDASNKQSYDVANNEENAETEGDVYEEAKLEDIFKKARGGKSEMFTFASMFQDDQLTSQPDVKDKRDVYEQDKLEGIFKAARDDNINGSSNFSFGDAFDDRPMGKLNDLENEADKKSGSFCFGFSLPNDDKSEENSEQKLSTTKDELKDNHISDALLLGESNENTFVPRKRRVGLTFPENDLDNDVS
mmetsp:Transcript_26123/g.52335  ORF Transcript_26123/g.52335 Transcript_26123/m.52335 type:complete len:807 (-) Transcript_26123:2-2422(-)